MFSPFFPFYYKRKNMRYSKIEIRNTIRRLIEYFKMQEEVSSQEEMADLWSRIETGIKKKKQKRQRRYFIIATASAAALIGLMWLGVEQFLINNDSDISVVASKMTDKSAVGDDIQLIVSQKEVIPVKKGSTVTYSQSGTVSVGEEEISHTATEDLYDQIIVPKGKFTRLVLADGSSLHINAGTKVVYPKRFEKNRREIFVDGEIFIDVKRDESAPFFVKTARFEVEVLGTAFNVSAYKEDDYGEVVLLRGAVNLKDSKKNTLKLSPNQLASVGEGAIQGKKDVNAVDYIAWTKGLFVLNTEPLERVFLKLERYYGISIKYDDAVKEMMVCGILDLNYSLEEVLSRIAITAPIKYESIANGFLITKK